MKKLLALLFFLCISLNCKGLLDEVLCEPEGMYQELENGVCQECIDRTWHNIDCEDMNNE